MGGTEQAEAGYEALWEGGAAVEVARDVVRVAGPDAERYLQGQLSQDLERVPVGGAAWALLLQPQGRLVALVRCARLGDQEFLLYTDAGMADAVVERLLRFRLRTKADVERLDWRCLAVRGAPPPSGGAATAAVFPVPFAWGAFRGYDLLGPTVEPPPGGLPATPEAYEVARVEAGLPVHGAELDERTIPAEAGLVDEAVSFTKGCYTGQELVARIDSRGSNVPRRLWGFVLSGPAPAGAALVGGSREVGRLTSVIRSPRLGWAALGYAARGTAPGAILDVAALDVAAGRTAEVRALPLRGQ